MNHGHPDVQYGFRKGRGTREKKCQHLLDHRKNKRIPVKYLLLLYWLRQNLWLCRSQQAVENSLRDGNTRPFYLPPEKFVQGQEETELHMEQQTGSKFGKEYVKAVSCHPAYLTSLQIACMHSKSLQSCLTLCNPMDSSPIGSSVHGIL